MLFSWSARFRPVTKTILFLLLKTCSFQKHTLYSTWCDIEIEIESAPLSEDENEDDICTVFSMNMQQAGIKAIAAFIVHYI